VDRCAQALFIVAFDHADLILREPETRHGVIRIVFERFTGLWVAT
jgi:hypothetical protein